MALEETFSVKPIIAFRKNISLKQLIGGNTIEKDKNIKKSNNKCETKCKLSKSGIRSLCCLQVRNTYSSRSQQNVWIFTIVRFLLSIFYNVRSVTYDM